MVIKQIRTHFLFRKLRRQMHEALRDDDLCVCGDYRGAHDHFRQGTDCSMCKCRRFDKAGSL